MFYFMEPVFAFSTVAFMLTTLELSTHLSKYLSPVNYTNRPQMKYFNLSFFFFCLLTLSHAQDNKATHLRTARNYGHDERHLSVWASFLSKCLFYTNQS